VREEIVVSSVGLKLSITSALLALMFLPTPVWSDLDVNAVAGTVLIDGSPAPIGTIVVVNDVTVGYSMTTRVDGSNVPPFERGQGKFDTGDVPQFNTGDLVIVSVQDSYVTGSTSARLSAGTTSVMLRASKNLPPVIADIPEQTGLEDCPWELDLDSYISDPDTPVSALYVQEDSKYASLQGHTLIFLYPEGVTEDLFTIRVSDGTSTVTKQVDVTVTPVNDPPVIGGINGIDIVQGGQVVLNLSSYTTDPDDRPEDLVWSAMGYEHVTVTIQGALLTVLAPEDFSGNDSVVVTVRDSAGLTGNTTVYVRVSENLTALVDSLREQVRGLQAQLSALEEENRNLSVQVQHLSDLAANLSLEKQALTQTLGKAQSNMSHLIHQLSELRSRLAFEQELVDSLTEENSTLEEQLSSLREQLVLKRLELEEAAKNITALRSLYEAKVEELNGTISALQLQIQGLLQNQSAKNDIIANLTSERAHFQDLVASREATIAELESLRAQLQDQVSSLKGENTTLRQRIEELNLRIKNLEREEEKLRSQLIEASSATMAIKVKPAPTTSSKSRAGALFSSAARAATGGIRLGAEALRNKLLLMVVSVVFSAYAVSILSKTSWSRSRRLGAGASSLGQNFTLAREKDALEERPAGRPSEEPISPDGEGAFEKLAQPGQAEDLPDSHTRDSQADLEYARELIRLGFREEAERILASLGDRSS